MPDEPIAILREEYPWGGRICELYQDRLSVRDAVSEIQAATLLPLDLFDPAPSRTAKRLPTPAWWAYLIVAMSVGAVYLGGVVMAIAVLDHAPVFRIVLFALISLVIAVCMAAFFRSRKREFVAFKNPDGGFCLMEFERFKRNAAELDTFIAKMSVRISAVPPRVDKRLALTFPIPSSIKRSPEYSYEHHPALGDYVYVDATRSWGHGRITASGVRCTVRGDGRRPEPSQIELWHEVELRLPELAETAVNAIPPPPDKPGEYRPDSIVLNYIFLQLDGAARFSFGGDFCDKIMMWPDVEFKDWKVSYAGWEP